jgi:hypothetical protein
MGNYFDELSDYISALRDGSAPAGTDVELASAGAESGGTYTVRAFNDRIAGLMKPSYTRADMAAISASTADLRDIRVVRKPWGAFVGAASFESDETAESTNYDAVWVRDSVWGCLALASDEGRQEDARDVLLTQLDYMASQSERIDRVIESPDLLDLPSPDGDMNAVHIRFDSATADFADVMDDGKPQRWTHKQNDAIGLLLDAVLSSYGSRLVTLNDLTSLKLLAQGAPEPSAQEALEHCDPESGTADGGCERLAALVRLVAYLNAVKYYEMEDSGAWEELPRRNTSSIGIVVAALEKLAALLSTGNDCGDEHPACDAYRAVAFAEVYGGTAERLGLADKAGAEALDELIALGYAAVRRQLSLGGESPDYEEDDPHYREADAAMLSLIYPANPKELSTAEKLEILRITNSLTGEFGVKRYAGDNYQAGNFWWRGIRTDADPESHKKREESFIAGTEAEWFFDSWYGKCCLIVADELEAGPDDQDGKADPEALREEAVKRLNRALGQITGEGMCSADGRPAPADALPESYNHIVTDAESWPAPSPIAPLNWAKASLTLMLHEFLRAG